MLSLLPWWAKALIVAALLGLAAWGVHLYNDSLREDGRQEVRAEWDKERIELGDRALAESESKAKESLRRMEAQRSNQDAQDRELGAARVAAARNAADADRLRQQSASAARDWAARLADSPTAEDLAAAGAAIGVLTDLLGRADRRAGVLASYADTARAAGLKCERDYDALKPSQP